MSAAQESGVGAAQRAYEQRRYADAERICRDLLTLEQSHPGASLTLAKVCWATGRSREAQELLEKVLRLDSNSVEALNWLAMVQRANGRVEESKQSAIQATQIDPSSATAHFNLGMSHLALRDPLCAAEALQIAIDISPEVANYYYHLGVALEQLEQLDDAESAFRKAVALAPSFEAALLALAEAHVKRRAWRGAEAEARNALTVNPDSPRAHMLLGLSLANLAKAKEAEQHLKRASELQPALSRAREILAYVYQAQGNSDGAFRILESELERSPENGSAFLLLMQFKTCTERDLPLVESMRAAVETADPKDAWQIHFGIGKAFDDLGEYKSAMEHFEAAHRILAVNNKKAFDRSAYSRTREQFMSCFDAEFLQRNKHGVSQSSTPIFVVGSIRSGTTLIEQMLARHPMIGTAGEQPFWPANADGAFSPETKTLLPRAASLAGDYLDLLRVYEPSKPRVIDKNPGNLILVGLLHVLFPNARFVHMRRNPVDTCLSIYMTPGASQIAWTHAKGDLAFAYEQHEIVAEHWRKLMPQDRYVEVRYEDLVLNCEHELRRVLEFCGLEWDEMCLHSEGGELALSPSLAQVRKPIHSRSVGKWRNYEPWLGELGGLLNPSNTNDNH